MGFTRGRLAVVSKSWILVVVAAALVCQSCDKESWKLSPRTAEVLRGMGAVDRVKSDCPSVADSDKQIKLLQQELIEKTQRLTLAIATVAPEAAAICKGSHIIIELKEPIDLHDIAMAHGADDLVEDGTMRLEDWLSMMVYGGQITGLSMDVSKGPKI